MIHQLYKITNKLNGKYYIGVHTGDIFKDDYWGSGIILKESIEKHGKENFEREIIKQLNNKKEIYKLESEIVNEQFIHNQQTYNVSLGGNGGDRGPIVNKQKSENMMGDKNMWYGKKRPEHSKWLKENPPFKNKTHSTESLKKMMLNHPNTKKILQYAKDGTFIKEWDSANQAKKELGISVHRAAQGNRKTAGGFIWKYKK